MAVQSVEITNFTVFKNAKMAFSPGVNVLMGENGTGKTHLLKVLYAPICGLIRTLGGGFRLDGKYRMDAIGFEDLFFDGSFSSDPIGALSANKSDSFLVDYVIDGEQVKNDSGHFQIPAKVFDADAVYIPVKDMLTHAKGFMSLYNNTKIPFDRTYYEMISKALLPEARNVPELAQAILPKLEKMMNGTVVVENETFYIQKRNGEKIAFAVEAEGLKKIGLLWQLLMNESITKSAVLLWDEPEANVNPKLIPQLVSILLALARQGVQIFVATHDYIFAKYVEVLSKEEDHTLFHSLFKTEQGVQCETSAQFSTLAHNDILLV